MYTVHSTILSMMVYTRPRHVLCHVLCHKRINVTQGRDCVTEKEECVNEYGDVGRNEGMSARFGVACVWGQCFE